MSEADRLLLAARIESFDGLDSEGRAMIATYERVRESLVGSPSDWRRDNPLWGLAVAVDRLILDRLVPAHDSAKEHLGLCQRDGRCVRCLRHASEVAGFDSQIRIRVHALVDELASRGFGMRKSRGFARDGVFCKPDDKPGCSVYFILAKRSNLVKIGRSWVIQRRKRELSCGAQEPLYVLGSVLGDFDDEASFHARFAHLRSHGEFFHLRDDLADYLISLGFLSLDDIPTSTMEPRR